ncbi:unnamed protein product [Owenia fusiformis]|uniref:Uncharacterized protein n=1 Tax=Owenia fusiformis TaxID=6347 RepID=A0A8J1UJJ1_OWEFU|nr:unnamed protein product [Owenia fusiformis]
MATTTVFVVLLCVGFSSSDQPLVSPSDTAVLVGDQVTMKCEQNPNEPISTLLAWKYKAHDQTIDESISAANNIMPGPNGIIAQSFTFGETTYDLLLSTAASTFAGRYTCEDIMGTFFKSADLLVVDPTECPSSPMTVTAGDTVTLTLTPPTLYQPPGDSYAIKYIWKKDGNILAGVTSNEYSEAAGTASFTISVEYSVYKGDVLVPGVQESCEVVYNVELPTTVTVITRPTDKAACSGDNVVVTCEIDLTGLDLNQEVTYWDKMSEGNSNTKLSEMNTNIVPAIESAFPGKYGISSTSKFSLEIRDVQIDNAGGYSCIDASTGNPIGDIANLIVIDSTCPEATKAVTKGDNIVLECSFQSSIDAGGVSSIEWSVDGNVVSAGITETKNDKTTTSTYTTQAVTNLDGKTIKCSITHLENECECLTSISIITPPTQGITVTKGPSHTAVLMGAPTVTLDCEVQYDQTHIISWEVPSKVGAISTNLALQNGIDANKYAISTTNPLSLEIKNVDGTDVGRYTCLDVTGNVALGGIRPYLMVMEKMECPTSPIEVKEGEEIQLQQILEYVVGPGNNPPQSPVIAWVLNGSPLDPNEATVFVNPKNTLTSVVTYNPSTAGTLTFTASVNFWGYQDECTHTYNVASVVPEPVDGSFDCRRHNTACQNGGVCNWANNVGTCNCPSGYSEFDCSIQDNTVGGSCTPECVADNTLACVDVDGGTCVCKYPFTNIVGTAEDCSVKRVDVTCTASNMVVTIIPYFGKPKTQFEGKIFIRDFDDPPCDFSYVNSEYWSSGEIGYEQCGVNKTDDAPKAGMITYEVKVVVAYDPWVITSLDEVVTAQCTMMATGEITTTWGVENVIDLAALKDGGSAIGNVSPVSISVTDADGNEISSSADIGEPLELHFMQVDPNAGTFAVTSCTAYDKMTMDGDSYPIIQDRCIAQGASKVINFEGGPIEITEGKKVLRFLSFKFPGTSSVVLQCDLEICADENDPACADKTDCDGPVSQGLRKRAATSNIIEYRKSWTVTVKGAKTEAGCSTLAPSMLLLTMAVAMLL